MGHIDHAAIRAKDFEWHLDFFQRVFGMDITLTDPRDVDLVNDFARVRQVWVGGIQLQRAEDFNPAEHTDDRLHHVGIAVSDVAATLDKVYAVEGVTQAPGKDRNWFILPEGLMIEVIPEA